MARPQDPSRILSISRAFLDRFRPEFRAQRTLVICAFSALLAQTLLRLLEPWPLGIVIDRILGIGGEAEARPLSAIDASPEALLALAAVAVVVIAALRALAGYAGTVGFALVGNRVLTAARERVFRHLQSLSLAFHTRSRSGDAVVRVISDVGTIRDVTVTALLPLVANLLVLVGVLGVMAIMDFTLTLIAISIIPLFWLTVDRVGRRIHSVSRKQRRREGELASTAAESLVGIETVQALALNDSIADRFGRQNQGSMKEGVKAKRLSARLERSVDVLAAASTGLVLYFGARTVLDGALRVGELVVFMSYLKTATRPVRGIAKYAARLAKASAAAERVLDILDEQCDIVEQPDATDAHDIRGDISFEGVTLGYERDRPILSGIDLEIRAGSRVSVIGESGAGKSTLVASLLRLIDPLDGRITIDARDLRTIRLASLRRQIAVVPQETLLFAGTVAENISMGIEETTAAEIVAAAHDARADRFIRHLPSGYDTVIGERGADLSVGQRRRISLARARLSCAPIVVLDEPLAGLDPENRREVEAALDSSVEGRTTILVTHDADQVMDSDWVVALDGGRIVEMGAPGELAERDGFFARWLAAGSRAPSAKGASLADRR